MKTTMNARESAYRLTSSKNLDPLIERIGTAHYVLLGEASHGTHEYYTWRSAISKRLIEEKGFSIIAVEGDWPDCYKINRYIKGYKSSFGTSEELLKTFTRWPTWMWANWEIDALISWLKNYNDHHTYQKVSFYGLDVYSLWESMEVMLNYLKQNDPPAAELAKNAIQCFDRYNRNEFDYATQWHRQSKSCMEPLSKLLKEIRTKAASYDHDPEAELNLRQNAHIAVNAEAYYRNMVGLSDTTWNLRDTHMVDTLNRITDFYGPDSKVIIWEHNTHIGDARFTDMQDDGMINVGQLVREEKGAEDCVLVGFGSYRGRVIAGENWGSEMEEMNVPPARASSIEAMLHNESTAARMLIFDQRNEDERFSRKHGHRAIGVVYNPGREKYGNYVPTVLNKRYDIFIYLDQTSALHPLPIHADSSVVPETYPFSF